MIEEDKKETIKDMLELNRKPMTIKEVLENYKEYKAEIHMLKCKYKNVDELTVDAGTSCYDGIGNQKDFYVEGKLGIFVVNKTDKLKEIQKEIDDITERLENTDNFIDTLGDYQKNIIKLRYIEKWEIWKIAKSKVDGENEKSEDAIKKTIKKAIAIMEEKYQKIYAKVESI